MQYKVALKKEKVLYVCKWKILPDVLSSKINKIWNDVYNILYFV